MDDFPTSMAPEPDTRTRREAFADWVHFRDVLETPGVALTPRDRELYENDRDAALARYKETR